MRGMRRTWACCCALVAMGSWSLQAWGQERQEAVRPYPSERRAAVEATFDPYGAADEPITPERHGRDDGDDGSIITGVPVNDLCGDATVIPGDTEVYNPPVQDIVDATESNCEAMEDCEFNAAGSSDTIWYSYTPVADGVIFLDTFGSNFNTVLSVFSGCSVFSNPICFQPASEYACSDDYLGGQTSFIEMEVTAGETYIIKVGEYTRLGGVGPLNLDFNFEYCSVPVNDQCHEATEIVDSVFDPAPYNTQCATVFDCENAESCASPAAGSGKSVWYTYTPPCSGTLSINTNGSDYDTVISVWDMCGYDDAFNCVEPTELACDDDGGTGAQSQIVDLEVIGGIEYVIKVASKDPNVGGMLDFNFIFNGGGTPFAELELPQNFTCVCDSISVVGTASADPDESLNWILEYQYTVNDQWVTIATGTTPVYGDELALWDTSALPAGYYFLRLTVENACGFAETDVAIAYIDQGFDNLVVSGPADGYVYGATVCVGGTVHDNCGATLATSVSPAGQNNFTPLTTTQPPLFNTTWATWDTIGGGWPDGDYDIKVEAEDICGHALKETVTITVDNTPPVTEITSPLPCTTVEGLVEVYGTAFDANLVGWTLQYTGDGVNGWVTIASGNTSIVDSLLAVWDTTGLPSCAYTLRLVASDSAILNCNGAYVNNSEYLVSVDVGDLCPVDFDGDQDEDLFDYAEFQNCYTGP